MEQDDEDAFDSPAKSEIGMPSQHEGDSRASSCCNTEQKRSACCNGATKEKSTSETTQSDGAVSESQAQSPCCSEENKGKSSCCGGDEKKKSKEPCSSSSAAEKEDPCCEGKRSKKESCSSKEDRKPCCSGGSKKENNPKPCSTKDEDGQSDSPCGSKQDPCCSDKSDRKPCCSDESKTERPCCSKEKKEDSEEKKEGPCGSQKDSCCSKKGEVKSCCSDSSKESEPCSVKDKKGVGPSEKEGDNPSTGGKRGEPCCSKKKEKSCCSDKSEGERSCSSKKAEHVEQSDGKEKKPCCESKKDNPCCGKKVEKSACCDGKETDNNKEEDKGGCGSKSDKPSCCSSKSEKKTCHGKSEDMETSGKEGSPCSSKKQDPCCASKKQEKKPCCSPKKEGGSPCCPPKKEEKNPCCSSKKEDESPCSSKTKDPCCASQKKEQDPCCSSKQAGESPCSSKKKDPCCVSKKQEQDPCCSLKKEEARPCCASKHEDDPCSSSTKEESVDKKEQRSPCCSSEKQQSSPCCASKEEKVDPCCAKKEAGPCGSSKKKEDECPCCLSEEEDEAEPCCSGENDCCAEQDDEDSVSSFQVEAETQKLLRKKNESSSIRSSVSSLREEETDAPQQTGKITTKLRVQNICCALEAQLVKDTLAPLEGIENVAVNVIGRVVHIRHDLEVTSVGDILDTLNKVHLGATVMETGDHHETDEGFPTRIKLLFAYVAIQTALFIAAVVGLFLKTKWYKWVAIAEIIFGAAPILKRALVSVKNLRIDINILMLIAIAGTLALSDYVEGATVVFVFALADALQEFSMFKVQRTISRLMLKRPQVAVLVDSGECVDIETVSVGTLIAVRPGELIPLDGIVVKGRASVDESSITGEALPVEKVVDSLVYSGTVDQNGYLEIKTTSDSSSSTVSKVANMVQEAQSSTTQTEAIINRFAKYYTPLIVVTASLVVVVPAILGAAEVGTYSQELPEWGRKALVLLVVACPCALVMSAPIAVVCSITAAARKGALIKGGEHLEILPKLGVLAFDKTGTLTEGKFEVTDIDCAYGVNEREALRLAAGVENKSSHPIAAAVVNEFSGCVASMVTGGVFSIPEVKKFKMHEGRGISGVVEGKRVLVGNRKLVEQGEVKLGAKMEEKFYKWSNESKTVVFACINGELALMIALADAIRPNTCDALYWLSYLGVQTSMITGDNARTANAVKEQLGLDETVSEMKPGDKLEWIQEKQGRGEELMAVRTEVPESFLCSCCRRKPKQKKLVVGMVGDGVNDGPALAAADLGIAMGAGGTALAVEAADITLMSNNLSKIPELISLGKFCRRIVTQNIGFSVLLKLILVVVALAGYVALWMAVVGDALGLLFVIINGLRPLVWQAETYKKRTAGDDKHLQLHRQSIRNFYMYESFV